MSYVIKGGQQGSDRLAVIADALRQTTAQLLDRAGSLAGATIVDAACGGGHVTLELAERVGPRGHVFGFDLDAVKLNLATALVNERGLSNITFMRADVLDAWPVDGVDLIYARFILTHLQQPETCLARAKAALRAGGRLVIEDIDIEGRFSDPPCVALDRADVLYIEAVRRQGGDPLIGRRLHRLVERAGFAGVQIGLVQPFARQGSAKQTAVLTLSAIAGSLTAAGIATRDEVEALLRDIEAFTSRPDTTVSMPRIFQTIATRP